MRNHFLQGIPYTEINILHILDWILNSVLSHGFQMGMHYSRVLQIHIEVNFSLLSKSAFFPGPNLVKNVKAFHFQKRI